MKQDLNHDRPQSDHTQYDEEYNHSNYEARSEHTKKPWYNRGWVWLIVAFIGIGVIFFSLTALTQETANINESIQDQTAAIKEQSQILHSINDSINNVVIAIKDAVIAIKDTIYNLFT